MSVPNPNESTGVYPIPAYLNFCPGGVAAKGSSYDWYDLLNYSNLQQHVSAPRSAPRRKVLTPDILVSKAKSADDKLRQYSLLFSKNLSTPFFLPSLSILVGAAFGRLSGVPSNAARKWADTMILHYYDLHEEQIPMSQNQIHENSLLSSNSISVQETNTVALLKRILRDSEAAHASSGAVGKPRPCGYVFKRGDIAWNCRTCQTDPTCVICDKCFHESNHEGHDVYFHRTTPGGCCDCGDPEAWKIQGCCPLHRPQGVQQSIEPDDDPEEAVKTALRGQNEGLDILKQQPTSLPPKLAAALAIVIGGAVQALVDASDGAGIGADPVQWKMRWADEAAKIWNGVNNDEEYYGRSSSTTPQEVISGSVAMPRGYRLELRLHNDDVHTFDEVIEALHEPRYRRTADDSPLPLVPHREDATDMTQHVDSDGQVTVKYYITFSSAMIGYRHLKSKGLHCSVVSTAQVDAENRARALTLWMTEVAAAHPAAAVIVVQALLQVSASKKIGNIYVWHEPKTIPTWTSILDEEDEVKACHRRFSAFPPHLESSYLTREDSESLHRFGAQTNLDSFIDLSGTDPLFYDSVPYRLPSFKYRKSPHSLWGTLPSTYNDAVPIKNKHQILYRIATGEYNEKVLAMPCKLSEYVIVVDTDLRKQQESELILTSMYPHKIPGLYMISGVGTLPIEMLTRDPSPLPNPMDWRNLLATSSFRAPVSPVILLLLNDPYPTKLFRSALHALILSLLVDSRFKCRFAAALGAVAYRPLSTLFCAGVGTESDTPLGFTVQIFTAGSLVRALGNPSATEKLLRCDQGGNDFSDGSPIGVFSLPIAHAVLRCIHTNLLGSTKEVNMILNNTLINTNDETMSDRANDSLLPALTYQVGEHPLLTQLPAAPDDGFLDSRSTRHKRVPHLLRDLEYIMETPGTSFRLLSPQRYPVFPKVHSLNSQSSAVFESCLSFPVMYSRLLRIAQGMDPQKRKISGGHVEYEQNRWLEAFGLSLNFAGTRDALTESLTNSSSAQLAPFSEFGSHLGSIRDAMGQFITALLRELKLWLYREGLLETGLPLPPGGAHGAIDNSQVEALQRSTLHVSSSQLGEVPDSILDSGHSSSVNAINSLALSCATGVKMTEAQLELIESALRLEGVHRHHKAKSDGESTSAGPVMADWLRIPHSPLGGDTLSFHLPLHRSLAKCVRCICYVPVPEATRKADPNGWWKIPILDDDVRTNQSDQSVVSALATLLRPTLRSSNCRVAWLTGPDCTSSEAQRRRSRLKNVSSNIASAKVIHSLADHPIRCIASAQQIERHLWARNGSSTAGMALNYSNSPLCRSFRDLDVTLVQLSAAGLYIGLGAKRIFSLLINRFNLDGYLCDPERRVQGSLAGSTNAGVWVNPPRLQDPEQAVSLSDSFFITVSILVTELPPPSPLTSDDNSSLRDSLRRELLHALAAEPRSHSEAMEAATSASSRRDESAGISGGGLVGGMLGELFTEVLRQVGIQKNQGSARATSGPSAYELRAECCDEYDPTFYHLRRQDHQHAMDRVARLRKSKSSQLNASRPDGVSFPIVCAPPKAHPRFLPCRLLLHLPSMDAAIRRALLFAVTGGSWLPPAEPSTVIKVDEELEGKDEADSGRNHSPTVGNEGNNSLPVTTFSGRSFRRASSSVNRKAASGPIELFSPSVVAASSVSCLEFLQLLTLQVHTLEECASLHRLQPDLDDDTKALSAGLSINKYLGRLIHVPDSIANAWALKPYPEGPLPSKGSGSNRGSLLGLMIILYEHRSLNGKSDSNGSASDSGGDEGHGGARSITESGLVWLLRFVYALVDGAPNVGAAIRSATLGVRVKPLGSSSSFGESWMISDEIRKTVTGMLLGISDLWPKEDEKQKSNESEKITAKSKEARKAAQQRVMAMMKQKQHAFAATITPNDAEFGSRMDIDEDDLCIICRCDDTDGENNGPLGYLGHVQRSRCLELRSSKEASQSDVLYLTYRVAGHRGCQLRKSQSMDSEPIVCLPTGSIVRVLSASVSDKYGILSRRVFVRHVETNQSGQEVITEGWASVQSSEGYVILSPMSSMCFSNTRWGSTRPIIRQCGHAAHLECVETHTLSLHQRAAGEQPYDGRFAANIDDGEFLCPLCKQLSNILIPRDGCERDMELGNELDIERKCSPKSTAKSDVESLKEILVKRRPSSSNTYGSIGKKALKQFGSKLLQGMTVPWERASPAKKRKQLRWHRAIPRWDYDDSDQIVDDGSSINDLMSLLRQQHIAWAALGHAAAVAEASCRSLAEVTAFGTISQTTDPWANYSQESKDSHPMVMEIRRTLTAASGLFEVLVSEMEGILQAHSSSGERSIIGSCLSDVLFGESWYLKVDDADRKEGDRERLIQWSQLMALISATPCHVARDGMLSQRHEARACASSMWTVKGIGTENSHDISGPLKSDLIAIEPPTPLAIRQIIARAEQPLYRLKRGWGTMDPGVQSEPGEIPLPFRPGVAASYLYIPLLAWDLNTLAGAVFSTSLSHHVNTWPSRSDLLSFSRILLVGRLIQVLITPHGFELANDGEDEDYLFDFWTESEITIEGKAVVDLLLFCNEIVKPSFDIAELGTIHDPQTLSRYHGAIGRAILPFGRSLILLLRASLSAICQRERKGGIIHKDLTPEDKKLEQIAVNDSLFSYEDGLLLLRELGGPLPSFINSQSQCTTEPEIMWRNLIQKWLKGVHGLELHHGCRGSSCISQIDPTYNFKAITLFPPPNDDRGPTNVHDNFNRPIPENEIMDHEMLDTEIDHVEELVSDDVIVGPLLGDDMDMENSEEEITMGEQGFRDTMTGVGRNTVGGELLEDSSDDGSFEASSISSIRLRDSEKEFAFVSKSPIIPHQPSLLGIEPVGPGTRGVPFEIEAATRIMRDLSHLGSVHRKDLPTNCLIRLPKSFVELYGIVNRIKGRESLSTEEADESGNSETAICLLTGTVMRSGSPRRHYNRSARPPGTCTIHARHTGSGVGIFFLVQKCTVLLMHNNKSAYSASIYVDQHGEEDPGLRRGRPLILNEARYQALELLWRQQGVPREVAQIRSTSDRVIRDNWY